MATFRIVILKHTKRQDDKYPVSIRVTHQQKLAYITTGYYVSQSQISKKFELRDNLILLELSKRIQEYEHKMIGLGQKVNNYSVRELADFVSTEQLIVPINFIEFFENHRNNLNRKQSTIANYNSCLNHLRNFKKDIYLTDIDNNFLISFHTFLQKNNVGKRGQQLYLTLLKSIFNTACKKYKKETKKYIEDAFEDFIMPKVPIVQKRNITTEKIRELIIFNINDRRMIFARDVFLISFLLCGTNTIDLYYLEKPINGRLSYKRSKTTDRRKDEAFISYKIEPELLPFLEKYKGKEKAFDFIQRYQNHISFNGSTIFCVEAYLNCSRNHEIPCYAAE